MELCKILKITENFVGYLIFIYFLKKIFLKI